MTLNGVSEDAVPGWVVAICRVIIIVVGLLSAIPVVFLAAMATAFSGSTHGAPDYYLLYLGITQVIPVIVAAISWIAILFTLLTRFFSYKWLIVLLVSVFVYGASMGGVFIILSN